MKEAKGDCDEQPLGHSQVPGQVIFRKMEGMYVSQAHRKQVFGHFLLSGMEIPDYLLIPVSTELRISWASPCDTVESICMPGTKNEASGNLQARDGMNNP